MLKSTEFQTPDAASDKAREEKTVLKCGRCSSGAEAERKPPVPLKSSYGVFENTPDPIWVRGVANKA